MAESDELTSALQADVVLPVTPEVVYALRQQIVRLEADVERNEIPEGYAVVKVGDVPPWMDPMTEQMNEDSEERSMSDAPNWYSAEEAGAWAAGWNAAVAKCARRATMGRCTQHPAESLPCKLCHRASVIEQLVWEPPFDLWMRWQWLRWLPRRLSFRLLSISECSLCGAIIGHVTDEHHDQYCPAQRDESLK